MKNLEIFMKAVLAIIFISCGSEDKGSDTLPANLVVNATVSTDKTGKVTFNATADNVTSYVFEFGDGISEVSASGNTTYKYFSTGNYTVKVTAYGENGQSINATKEITVDVVLAMVWSDEFNTDGQPDGAKWGYDIGTGSNGWGNNEAQYYTSRPENVTITGGILKITARKESYSGSAYTSARMLTKGKYSFKYGRIEVKAKLPEGVGTWPAIWMLGDNISTAGWPACGEIDIMEHRGKELNKIVCALHHPGHSGGNPDGSTTTISGATTAFHRYSAEWTPAYIRFYVDDVLFYTFVNSSSVPFNQNFFVILNVAMGGTFGGTIDPAFTSASMEVDYVRVYQ